MVIGEIKGGLGNQLFMYAAARALALRTNGRLLLNHYPIGMKDRFCREYMLHHFDISGRSNWSYVHKNSLVGKFFYKLQTIVLPFVAKNLREAENQDYDPTIRSLTRGSYSLSGYFQSALYFEDYEETIRQDLTFVDFDEGRVAAELETIRSYGRRSVALCVRRYQEVKEFVRVSVVQKDFYLQAMDIIKRKIPNAVFFCFTQVPEWVEENLSGKGYQIFFFPLKQEDDATLLDFYLLQQFDNYIISNSTYYWWGAWLSKSTEKTVITSGNWICNKTPAEGWMVI